MENYSEEQIQKIIQSYHNKKEREKEHYDKIKDTEEFKSYNRQKVKDWYSKNKDRRKEEYENNKEIRKARSSYYYYKRINRLDDFKIKFPDKHKLLIDNFFIDV